MKLETYERRERNQVSDSTLSSRMSALRNFNDFIGDTEPTVEDVEEWVDHLIEKHESGGIKSSTIRQYYKAVKYYFEKVKNEPRALDHISSWIPEQDVDHGAYLTEEEWEQLRFNIHNVRNRAFIEIMYEYARRPTEVLLLNEEDIDFDDGKIIFNILKKEKDDRGDKLPMLKLKRDGEVYQQHRVYRTSFELTDDAEYRLNRLLEYKKDREEQVEYDGQELTVHPVFSADNVRMSYDAVRHFIKKAAKQAGIDKNIIPKSGRHSRATHLNWAGHTPEEIADKQLLHDPETNVIGAYVHSREEEDVREVMGTDE